MRGKRGFSGAGDDRDMSDRAESLRVIRARWSLLAAAGPVLAAAGAPLPFRASVDGVARGVARYDSSSSAGATLAWLDADRAVLSCGDAGWRVAAAPGPAGLLEGGPSWADHVTLLDHRVSAGHYGWAEFWDEGVRLSAAEPVDGAPLPPVFSTGRTAAALGARLEHNGTLFHLVRMSEYEWLDAASWRSAFGGLVPDRLIDESWETVVGFGLTQWTGGGPIEEGVAGRTPAEAKRRAAEHAGERGLQIPDEVRVESALRTPDGWQVRFMDYRDATVARPLVISVPDAGPVWIDGAEALGIRSPGTRPD